MRQQVAWNDNIRGVKCKQTRFKLPNWLAPQLTVNINIRSTDVKRVSVFSFLSTRVHIRSWCPSNWRTVFARCTKQDGAPDVTRWPPDPLTIRQATLQLHNNTQTQRIRLCLDKGCILAYSTEANILALQFENFTANIIWELGLNFVAGRRVIAFPISSHRYCSHCAGKFGWDTPRKVCVYECGTRTG